jgi:hypothetical protein
MLVYNLTLWSVFLVHIIFWLKTVLSITCLSSSFFKHGSHSWFVVMKMFSIVVIVV